MAPPPRASKLDPYGEEILDLHRQGQKLAEISKHLAVKYGLTVALSTLSEYVNRDRPSTPLPVAAAPAITPSQEMLLDQVEVYAEIQASVRVVVEEVQAMRNAFPDLAGLEGKIEAIGRQLDGLKAQTAPALSSEIPGELKTLLPQLKSFLDSQSARAPSPGNQVPFAIIRRIWIRAFWVTTALWLLAFAAATYWFGVWHIPKLK